jgi:hypothetical protein
MIFNEFVVAIDVDEILQQVERCSLWRVVHSV